MDSVSEMHNLLIKEIFVKPLRGIFSCGNAAGFATQT